MKKRLLSLLLAMAMIVSMVPFQALAEEPDETPALLETAEGIAPEDETTEVTIPETTEETVPETTEETAPETTEETVPETTEELVPETTEETISEVLEETVPELSELILPEGEAPENAPYIVKTRIGRPPVNLAMIENGALAGCTFAVDEEDAAYADIKDDSNLVLEKDITIPEGEDVVVHVLTQRTPLPHPKMYPRRVASTGRIPGPGRGTSMMAPLKSTPTTSSPT